MKNEKFNLHDFRLNYSMLELSLRDIKIRQNQFQ